MELGLNKVKNKIETFLTLYWVIGKCLVACAGGVIGYVLGGALFAIVGILLGGLAGYLLKASVLKHLTEE